MIDDFRLMIDGLVKSLQGRHSCERRDPWFPAFAGMTKTGHR